jgi:hypothetical protein
MDRLAAHRPIMPTGPDDTGVWQKGDFGIYGVDSP